MKLKHLYIAASLLLGALGLQSCSSDEPSSSPDKYVVIQTLKYSLNPTLQTATLLGCENPNVAAVNIPPTVTYKEISYTVNQIANEAFSQNSRLQSFTVPSSILWIGDYAIYNCFGIKKVTIEDSPTTLNITDHFTLGEGSLNNAVESVYLGRNLSRPLRLFPTSSLTIGKYVTDFDLYYTLYSPIAITCYATTPPKAIIRIASTISDYYNFLTVAVPASAVQMYKNDKFWGQFKIVAI